MQFTTRQQFNMPDIYSETEVYHTLDVAGRGTFGEVLKCWRGSDGELVAVKAMKIGIHTSRVIKNELKLTAALSITNLERSHIVQFYEAFRDPNHYYLVFEMLEMNLYQLQKKNGFRSLAIRNIRTVACQILRALAKLKALGIIHTDLKPENVMIVDHNRHPFRVKLIDFGSASIFSEVWFVKEPYIQSRFYRSPEVLLGLPFSEKVDMWSLGCVLAELLLGGPLYPGGSEHVQISYICQTQGLPPPHLLSSASKVHHFFEVVEAHHGAPTWQLKPTWESSYGESRGTSEHRKYVLTSLNDLCTMNHIEPDQTFRCEDAVVVALDCHSMVELIKRMLMLDPHERITPNSALRHSFITMQHLRASPAHLQYYHTSLQRMQQALIPTRTSTGMCDRVLHPFPDGATSLWQSKEPPPCPEGDHPHHSHPARTGWQNHIPPQGQIWTTTDPKPGENLGQPNPVQCAAQQMERLCAPDGMGRPTADGVTRALPGSTVQAAELLVTAAPPCLKTVLDWPPPWSCRGEDSLTSSMMAHFSSIETQLTRFSCPRPMSAPAAHDRKSERPLEGSFAYSQHAMLMTEEFQEGGGNNPLDLLIVEGLNQLELADQDSYDSDFEGVHPASDRRFVRSLPCVQGSVPASWAREPGSSVSDLQTICQHWHLSRPAPLARSYAYTNRLQLKPSEDQTTFDTVRPHRRHR